MLNKERNILFCILNFKNTLSLVPLFNLEVTGLMKPSPAGDIRQQICNLSGDIDTSGVSDCFK